MLRVDVADAKAHLSSYLDRRKLTGVTLYRAGWGDNSIALDDDLTTEPADALDALPRLIRVTWTPELADFLSWPDRSGCALQCLYQIEPVDRRGEPHG